MFTVAPVVTGSITQLNAFDPQALVLALQKGFLEHVQLQKGRFGGQIAHTQSGQCRTDWGRYNLALLAQGDLSAEWVTIGIFLQGEGAWYAQGQPLRNGDFVLYSEGSEMCITLPAEAQWIGVQFPRLRLEMLGFGLPAGSFFLHLPGQLGSEAFSMISGLAPVLGPQRVQDPLSAASERAHEALLDVIWLELARRWRKPSAAAMSSRQTRERLVQAVHAWCENHSEIPLRMETLCKDMDVPIWQLERAFHQTYGMAPQRLLTLQRLAKARRALLSQTGGVTEVAMSHGFSHLGRFSLLYKDYFGESPSETSHRSSQFS